jgi:ATP-dependent DNA helicase RecG
MDKSVRTVERYLKLAKDLGIIEFRGVPKTGGYYITQLMKNKINQPGK